MRTSVYVSVKGGGGGGGGSSLLQQHVVFQDAPRAPAINDDNLNFDTLVFAEAARLDELRKSPI